MKSFKSAANPRKSADGRYLITDTIYPGGFTHEHWELTEEAKAQDARLIAAAPDLLAALEAINDWWKDGAGSINPYAQLTDTDEGIAAIVARAIRKAKGE